MGATHRDKIKNSNLLSHLLDHALGKREMTPSQVTTGLGLLKKVMPDMQSQSFVDEDGNSIPTSIKMEFVSPNGQD